jgi:uncharacterized protein YciI
MYVVSLTYTAPLERIDEALADHVVFLDRHFATGTFLASGRKVPRRGGIILAGGVTREDLDRILDEDPFRRLGLATYEVTEFVASRTRPDLGVLATIG